MKAVAVKELEPRLSAYLREVKNGEVVLVTDRGAIVAELRQPSAMLRWLFAEKGGEAQ
jgi:prevent-host-death family protein